MSNNNNTRVAQLFGHLQVQTRLLCDFETEHADLIARYHHLRESRADLMSAIQSLAALDALEEAAAGRKPGPIGHVDLSDGRRQTLTCSVARLRSLDALELFDKYPESFRARGLAVVTAKGLETAVLAQSAPQEALALIKDEGFRPSFSWKITTP